MVQEIKSEFYKKINAQLIEIEDKITQIDLEIRQTGMEVGTAFAEELEILRFKLNEAKSKLNILSRSSKSVWQKLRSDLEEVVYDLNKAVDKALETAQSSR